MWRMMILALTVALGAGLAACGAPATDGFATISVTDLKQRLDRGDTLLVLDVRTPEEYAQDGHIAGSTLIPLQELAQRMDELPRDTPIACFCRSGNRSQTACNQLAQAGFADLVNVAGGIGAWRGAGYPVE